MQSRELHALLDILIASRLALSYVSGKTQTEFLADIQLQDSVIRRVEIIGEASQQLHYQSHYEDSQARSPQPTHQGNIANERSASIVSLPSIKTSCTWEPSAKLISLAKCCGIRTARLFPHFAFVPTIA